MARQEVIEENRVSETTDCLGDWVSSTGCNKAESLTAKHTHYCNYLGPVWKFRSKLREYTVFEMGLVNGMATKLCGTASSNKHPESELHQSTSIDPRYVQTHFQNRKVQQTLRHTPTHSLEGEALELSSAAEHTHKHTVKYHNSAALEN